VLLDGYNGVPTTNGNDEVSLDIEMAMAMAPGLSQIIVFSGGPNGNPNDILNSMLSHASTVKNLSSSWGWAGGPTTAEDNIFIAMAVQGQTFFNASGDSCAFTATANSINGVDNVNTFNCPASSPYITQVGATKLTMSGTASAYTTETVWNWGTEYGASYDGTGSSGGVSTHYSLPTWQTNIVGITGKGGSATKRNIPDVALTGENIYVISGGTQTGVAGFAGTSCAAPLWAGYMALINQGLTQSGQNSAGFINPFLYSLLNQANYTNCFHDVTNGNNTWSSSPAKFYTTNNYDLCTGLGTPKVGLIAAFLPVNPSFAISTTNLLGGGYAGGNFTWSPSTLTLSNNGTVNFSWTAVGPPTWLTLSSTNGLLTPNSFTNLSLRSTSTTSNLTSGVYTSSFQITNGYSTTNIAITLNLTNPITLSPNTGLYAVGPVGGPITYYPTSITLTNMGNSTIKWSMQNSTNWLNLSPSQGTNAAGTSTSIVLSATTNANSYPTYVYNFYANITNAYGTNTFANSLIITTPLVFSGISKTDNYINLQWNGSPYAYYQVWYSTNLTTTNWYALTAPFLPTNSNITILDTNTTLPSKFYQLQISP
jgi:subtilase family serine protease